MPSSLSARLAALQTQTGQQSIEKPAVVNNPLPANALSRLGQRRLRKRQSLLGKLERHLGVPHTNEGFIELHFSVPVKRAGLSGPYPKHLSGPLWPASTQTRKLVFVDTETTGLSGGTGTKVFQLGLCWARKDEIQVYQSLLTDPAAEAAFLKAFVEALPDDSILVSYNGKSFDMPLLGTRLTMNRLANPLTDLPHVDLLYAVRRAFRKSWSDCTLKSAEYKLLGVKRVDDLPGALAPEAWRSFILGRAYERVADVLRHNLQDIVSLAGLGVVATDVYGSPDSFGADAVGVAKSWYESDPQKAEAILQRCPPDDHEAQLELAELKRRQEGYGAAVKLWQKMANQFSCTVSLQRLAIYYEHYKKDPSAAHHYASQLVMLDCRHEHEHRLRRLVTLMR